MAIPPVMMEANWFQGDAAQVILVDYYFIPKPAAPAAWTNLESIDSAAAGFLAATKSWSKAWTPLLEAGVKGQLTVQQVKDALAHHPGGTLRSTFNQTPRLR